MTETDRRATPRSRAPVSALALALSLACPSVASAGGLDNAIDFLHFRPFVGYEISHVDTIEAHVQDLSVKTTSFDASGLAWGAYLGFRLGPISLDALYQRTDLAQTNDARGVTMQKLYADLGLNFGHDWIRSVVDIAFGYSFLDIDGTPRHQGFGGRIGISLDFFPTHWFSLGPTASFDAQGYSTENGIIGAYGGTFTLRIGFHL